MSWTKAAAIRTRWRTAWRKRVAPEAADAHRACADRYCRRRERNSRALERRGVIERYSAVVAPQKIGLSLVILSSVRLKSQEREATQAFETAVAAWPNIVECHVMTGAFDYLLKIVARDIADYESFLMSRLTRLKGVEKVESFVIMRTVKQSAIIPA